MYRSSREGGRERERWKRERERGEKERERGKEREREGGGGRRENINWRIVQEDNTLHNLESAGLFQCNRD